MPFLPFQGPRRSSLRRAAGAAWLGHPSVAALLARRSLNIRPGSTAAAAAGGICFRRALLRPRPVGSLRDAARRRRLAGAVWCGPQPARQRSQLQQRRGARPAAARAVLGVRCPPAAFAAPATCGERGLGSRVSRAAHGRVAGGRAEHLRLPGRCQRCRGAALGRPLESHGALPLHFSFTTQLFRFGSAPTLPGRPT